jgi:tetratricopeptide (TPR) repeat protein
VPLDWAMTQNNLGNALGTLGERESGTARLEEAVAAYRLALEEGTRDRVPLQWAGTQTNLGAALQTLGALESGTARLEEAVVAYRAALEEMTRERVPHQWAMSQHSLANGLAALAHRRTDRPALLAQAVTHMRNAVAGYRQVGDAYWGPIAERRLAKLAAAAASP